MTINKEEVRLFRKPKAPKLEKLDLTEVKYPDFYDDDTLNTESSESNSTLSTERDQKIKSKLPNLVSQRSLKDKEKLLVILEENSKDIPKNSIKTDYSSSTSSINDSNFEFNYDMNPKFKPSMRTIYSGQNEPKNRKLLNNSHASLYSAKNYLVKPFKVTGPDPLPMRPIKYHITDLMSKKSYYDNLTYESLNSDLMFTDLNYENKDDFTLNDFFIKQNYYYRKSIVDFCFDKVFLSTNNYKKICKLLADKIDQEKSTNIHKLNVQTLVPDIRPVEKRKPLRQSMIEMASYLKTELSLKTGTNLKAKFNPVSKWQKLKGAQSELVIYEDASKQDDIDNDLNDHDQVTVSQLAVVDSLLRNGLALSLKAHFIDKLPDMSSLKKTLIYINLSFNNFQEFPRDLLDIPQLECIKLRSNPIKYLPDRLSDLQNLKILSLGHCLFKQVPNCIFELENLIHLDLSYNKLKFIDEKIVNLKYLKTLNYEGNEIEYLPCCMLNMKKLEQINVKNNYLHPLIWRNIMKNQVQSLFDICAVKVYKYFDDESKELNKLSPQVKDILISNFNRCDLCGNKRFGDGLKLIRPCLKIFGVKYLPFLFHSCSIECFNSIKKKN